MSHTSQFLMDRYLPNVPFNNNLRTRFELHKEIFDKLIEDFDKVFNDYRIISLTSKITKSVSEYKIGNYDTSLVFAWFIIESFLLDKWEDWLKTKNKIYSSRAKRINKERYNKLKDYPISVISNILELEGGIPLDLFKKIDEIRSKRNKIVHQDQEFRCIDENCRDAFDVIKELFFEKSGIDLNISGNYGWSGLFLNPRE